MGPISIFGSGNWGLTLAHLAEQSGSEVMLWARRDEVAQALRTTRRHPVFLPHLHLGAKVAVSADLNEVAAFSRHWVVAVPSQHVRTWARSVAPQVVPGLQVLSASKGLEVSTQLRLSQVMHQEWQWAAAMPAVGAISGPNLAAEVSRGEPAAAVVVADPVGFQRWVERLGRAHLRLYRQADLVGVELGGALKNVLVIAVGMADGLGLGESTKAALITRGLHEMGRLATTLGANWTTLAGLSGLGDLVATAASPHSRNRQCGQALARGMSMAEILTQTPMVIEGVPTAYAAFALGRHYQLTMPITEQVVAILGGKPVADALPELMARALVDETAL